MGLDLSFGALGKVTTPVGSGFDTGRTIALDNDGKILVGGYAFGASDLDFAMVRYDQDGTLDPTFGVNGKVVTPIGPSNDLGRSIVVQPDGKILLGGYVFNGTNEDFAIARYDSDGSLDPTFGTGGMTTTPIGPGADVGLDVALQPDGGILLAGKSYNGSDDDFAVVRYTSSGGLDAAFGGGGKVQTPIGPGHDSGRAVVVQSDGKILVAGHASNGTNDDFALVRYDPGGVLDGSFGTGGKVLEPVGVGSDFGLAASLHLDDGILVAGSSYVDARLDFSVARFFWTGPVCGDGIVSFPEQCDDGNTADGDCCSATCEYEGSEGPCCSPAPATACDDAWIKGSLLVKESVAGKEKLIAKFVKGPAVDLEDFGDPTQIDGTGYAACVYDEAGVLVESLEIDRAASVCSGEACWKGIGPRQYLYKDPDASADGVRMIRLLAGPENKTQILLKAANNAKKGQLELPGGIAASLAGSSSVTVQFFVDDVPECFSLTFDEVKKATDDLFKAVKR